MKYGHKGNAKATTLAAAVGPTDMTINLADALGWPDGTNGPFWAALSKGLLGEEKVLCSGRSGNVLQVWTDGLSNGRGMDDTAAQDHGVNAPVEHVWTATEAEASSAHVNEGDGAHGYPAISSIVTLDGAQVITGAKTLETPHIEGGTQNAPTVTGGTHTAATKISVAGVQAETEFRVRNTYIGVGVPNNSLGNDGDLYIDKG